MNGVYVNPDICRCWEMDYRLYDPDGDGQSKLQHVQDMLQHAVSHKHLPFQGVLMDTWSATKWLMLDIERLKKRYDCPLKVNLSGQPGEYHRVDSLTWNEQDRQHGRVVHLKGFPNGHDVKLFRLLLSPERTDYIVTNDLTHTSSEVIQEANDFRWTVEQFHRETKQLTGIEACQCRTERI